MPVRVDVGRWKGTAQDAEDLTTYLGLLCGGPVERLQPGRQRRQPGRTEGEVEAAAGEGVSPALVARQGLADRPVPGQAVVDGFGQQFGGQEGV